MLDKSTYVYVLTNTINGKRYIGITSTSVLDRWRQHMAAAMLRNSQTVLHKAIRNYGKDAFLMETIATAKNRDEANQMEIDFIIKHKTRAPEGYNVAPGGEYCPVNDGRIMGAETRKKLSQAHAGKKKTPEHVAAMRAALTGRTLSPDHAAKIRLIGKKNKGKKHSAVNVVKARLLKRTGQTSKPLPISGYRGVYPSKCGGWQARIKRDGLRLWLGTFTTIEEAAEVYRKAAEDHKARLENMLISGKADATLTTRIFQDTPEWRAARSVKIWEARRANSAKRLLDQKTDPSQNPTPLNP